MAIRNTYTLAKGLSQPRVFGNVAGAGKTTTVAAKVKYLVDKKKVDPRQILVISFTNKAVNELKERIQREC